MAQEGIATLPMQGAMAAPQAVSSLDALDASKQALAQTAPGGLEEYEQAINALVAEIDLSPEEVSQLLQIVDFLLNNEARYPELRAQLIASGQADEEDLPPEFDRGYLTTILNVLLEKQARGGAMAMPAPQEFNKGGLADAAEALRRKGRNGDTVLAHINPEEAKLLKAMGGSGTINPATGLPEFFLKKAFKAVTKPIKKVASSTVGRVVLTVALGAMLGPAGLGLSSTLAGGLAAAGTTLAAGGNLKDALVSGAIGGISMGLAPSVGGVMPGTAGSFLNTALSAGAIGTGVGLLTGQNLKQALRTGALSGVTAAGIGALSNQMTPQSPAPVADGGVRATTVDAAGNVVATPGGISATNPAGTGATVLTPGAVSATNPNFGIQPGPAPIMAPAGTTAAAGGVPLGANYNFTPNYDLSAAAPAPASVGAPAASGISSVKPPEMTLGRIGGQISQGNYGQALSDMGTWMSQNKGTTAALALGATGALGGFKPTPAAPPNLVNKQTGQELINQDPNKYLVSGLPSSPVNTPMGYSAVVPTPTYGLQSQQAYPTFPTMAAYTPASYDFMPRMMAMGGIATTDALQFADPNSPLYSAQNYRNGGTAQYPRRTGQISGPGTETSDDIPAMLSDGEFVITAKAVRGIGNGSRREGAKKLYRMMHAMEKKAGGSV